MTHGVSTHRPVRWIALAAAGALLGGCSVISGVGDMFGGGGSEITDDPNRIPVLTSDETLTVDPDAMGAVTVPGAYVNDSWPQTGGAPSHAMQHPELGTLRRVWRRDIGEGDSRDSRITAQPVLQGGRIFVMDGRGEISAYDAEDGDRQWRVELEVEDRRDNYGFGGGLAVAGGRVYVSSGLGLMAALNVTDGSEIWRRETQTPMHSAPAVADGRVYAVTDDNVLNVYDAEDGSTLWSYQGLPEPARLLSSPAPAVLGDIIVSPFGSGELVALQATNGRPIWSDTLTRAGRLAPISTLNDVAGSPVIYDNVVYAMSHSGVLAAVSLETGERQWSLPAGGVNMPWLAGDTLFIMSSDGELAAVDRLTGQVRWMSRLPIFKNAERRRNRIAWAGPVLAGDRLIVVSSEGEGRTFNPATGAPVGEFDVGEVYVSPIVANRTLYVLDSDGQLSAYR